MPIDAKTTLYLILGDPVAHSLSPALHNAAFAALGLNCAYLAARVEEGAVEAAIKGLRALEIGGANVTSPHKEAVLPYLDEIDETARQVGAVNTIVNRDGKLHGTITDGEGFYLALKEAAPGYANEEAVTVIGAGGAVRAAVFTLARRGCREITVVNRSAARARELIRDVEAFEPKVRGQYRPLDEAGLKAALGAARVVIYSLPVDAPPVTAALRETQSSFEGKLLFDFRYQPRRTEVMDIFIQKGGRAFNGLNMLLRQAVCACKLFTGKDAPLEAMRAALVEETVD